MNELGFKIIQRHHAPGYTVPFVEYASGRLRRASEEEAKLWDALVKASTVSVEAEQKRTKK